jgi:hypothetical protein
MSHKGALRNEAVTSPLLFKFYRKRPAPLAYYQQSSRNDLTISIDGQFLLQAGSTLYAMVDQDVLLNKAQV